MLRRGGGLPLERMEHRARRTARGHSRSLGGSRSGRDQRLPPPDRRRQADGLGGLAAGRAATGDLRARRRRKHLRSARSTPHRTGKATLPEKGMTKGTTSLVSKYASLELSELQEATKEFDREMIVAKSLPLRP